MPTMSILNEVSSEQRIVHIWDINQAAIQTDDEQLPTGKHYQSSQNAELSTRRSSQAVTNVFFGVITNVFVSNKIKMLKGLELFDVSQVHSDII